LLETRWLGQNTEEEEEEEEEESVLIKDLKRFAQLTVVWDPHRSPVPR